MLNELNKDLESRMLIPYQDINPFQIVKMRNYISGLSTTINATDYLQYFIERYRHLNITYHSSIYKYYQ